jgi:CDP-glucose 4,6-dehydratase
LLEQVRSVDSVRAVVGVTTDKCYENRERARGYREDEALGGRDPYSSSKAAAELVIAAYRNSFLRESGVAVASARAGNALGGGDWAADRIVPDLLAAFARGEAAQLRRPAAVRPWQHVLDPLAGYLSLGRKLLERGDEFAEAWNFGPPEGELVAVAQLAEQVAAAWGNGARTTVSAAATPHEAHTLQLDASKARARLGWQPRWNVRTTIRATVEWHRAWIAGKDMRAFSLGQIERYSAAAA